jgi:hypothetical protein
LPKNQAQHEGNKKEAKKQPKGEDFGEGILKKEGH